MSAKMAIFGTHPPTYLRQHNIWMVPKRTQTSSEAAAIEDEWKERSSANMCMWMISRAIQILGRSFMGNDNKTVRR